MSSNVRHELFLLRIPPSIPKSVRSVHLTLGLIRPDPSLQLSRIVLTACTFFLELIKLELRSELSAGASDGGGPRRTAGASIASNHNLREEQLAVWEELLAPEVLPEPPPLQVVCFISLSHCHPAGGT